MHEIIDLNKFALVIRWLAVGLPVLGLLVGGAVGAARKALVEGLAKGLAIGLLGPVIYGLWLLYSYLIRYDPQTGYVGLHRTAVLWANIGLFAVVGIILGIIYGRVFVRNAPRDEHKEGAV
ncbi:MAG: hypothetical protein ABFE07_18225 [Armatimonadia bacterium]